MNEPTRRTSRLDDTLALHQVRLASLIGRRIDTTWVVWYLPAGQSPGALHGASPVILKIDDESLELWTVYVTQLHLTWNTIDLEQAPFAWTNYKDDDSVWHENAMPELSAAPGQVIHGISLMAHNEYCSGIEFALDSTRLVVFNDCDDTVILNHRPDWPTQWIPIS